MPGTITLAEIRKKYPQYAKVPDAQLASGLYKKFYAGKMSEDAFNQKIGFKAPAPPPKAPGLLERVNAETSEEGAIKRVEADIKEGSADLARKGKQGPLEGLKNAPQDLLKEGGRTLRTITDVSRLMPGLSTDFLNAQAAGGELMHALPGGDILAKALMAMGPEEGAVGGGAEVAKAAAPKELSPHLKAAQSLGAKGVQVLGVDDDTALDNWLRHTYDQVLAPVKQTFPKNVATGHAGYEHLVAEKNAAYDKALVPARGYLDNELDVQLRKLNATAAKVGKKALREYLKQGREALDKYAQDGFITGKEFKQVESDLRTRARQLKKSAYQKDRDSAPILYKLADTLRENLYRHSPPETVAALKAADTTYALLRRVGKATEAASGAKDGRFSPQQLLKASQREDTSFDHEAFKRGDAMLQKHATEGIHALSPPKKPLLASLMRRVPAWAIGGIAGDAAGHMFGGGVPFGLGREVGMLSGAALTEPALGAIHRALGSGQRAALARAATEAVGGSKKVGVAPVAAGIAASGDQGQRGP